MRVTRRRRSLVSCGLVALALATSSARAAPGGGEIVVFEAASLKDAFAPLAARFEKDSGAKVITNAAGSQELRAQIEHGAAADVFASADRKHMDALAAAGLARAPAVFACNELVVVVRPTLAATLGTFADLPRAARIVVGAPEVPAGAYTLQMLQKAGAKLGADFPARVEAKVASRELNVRQVLAKVVLGEADAGVVYRSDARAAAGKVHMVEIPPAFNVTAEYPIAVLGNAPHAALARRFVALVRSPAGTASLLEAGFVACPSS
jgi:molybdate transport system substrate-binding protein